MSWSPAELERIGAAGELLIVAGEGRRPLPIWVVCVGEEVFVRTWYRRDSGWFGRAVRAGRARISVPGFEAEVTVEEVGAGGLRAEIDAAYRTKYGSAGAESMVTDSAAATTLRLGGMGSAGN